MSATVRGVLEAARTHLGMVPDFRLRPGAPDELIRAVEEVIGFVLPREVRDLYAEHDGQDADGVGFVFGWSFDPLAIALANWRLEREAYGDRRCDWSRAGDDWMTDSRAVNARAGELRTAEQRSAAAGSAAAGSAGAGESRSGVESRSVGESRSVVVGESRSAGAGSTTLVGRRVRESISSPRWFPLSSLAGRTGLYADCDPGPDGIEGQLIVAGNEVLHPDAYADSATHFLHRMKQTIRSGSVSVGHDPDGRPTWGIGPSAGSIDEFRDVFTGSSWFARLGGVGAACA